MALCLSDRPRFVNCQWAFVPQSWTFIAILWRRGHLGNILGVNRDSLNDSWEICLSSRCSETCEAHFLTNPTPSGAPKTVLAVDLDGTLCRTDTLHEALFATLTANPAALPGMVSKLSEGKLSLIHI